MAEIVLDDVEVEDENRIQLRETCETCGQPIVDQAVVIAQGKIW